MDDDLIYQLALTQIPQIGSVHARILVQHFGSAIEIFKANQKTLEKIEGIGEIRAKRIKQFRQFASGEKESHFIQKYRITPLFMTDKSFPQRLLNCYDHPVLLFYKGAADLNASKIISIVGTRSNSDYGKQFTEKLIKELAEQHVVITSGLAFGIDAISHRAAVRHHLPTLGVVAHGLDQMYPQEHGNLAKEMIKEGGGILSEFRSGVKPDKHNFPGRNRIVAGISDATIVIETGVKGGSMITAELANSYNRDVFAIPGRVTDAKSAGCHHLIKFNKAILLTDAKQLIQAMGWDEKPKETRVIQPQLFLQLSEDEKCIVTMLNEKESLHIDEINLKSSLSTTSIAAAIVNLELQSLIERLPGKLYRLIR